MNTAMTYNNAAINHVRTDRSSFFQALRRFFNALLRANENTAYDLPADMAARLYL